MSNNKKVKEVEYTHVALGTFQDKETKEWFVAHISYNPETGDCKFDKGISEPSELDAKNRFKITAANIGIV